MDRQSGYSRHRLELQSLPHPEIAMPHSLLVFLASLGYALAGSVLLWAGYRLFDRFTPGDAHAKIFDEGNVAVAVLVGVFIIGLAIVVAAGMVG